MEKGRCDQHQLWVEWEATRVPAFQLDIAAVLGYTPLTRTPITAADPEGVEARACAYCADSAASAWAGADARRCGNCEQLVHHWCNQRAGREKLRKGASAARRRSGAPLPDPATDDLPAAGEQRECQDCRRHRGGPQERDPIAKDCRWCLVTWHPSCESYEEAELRHPDLALFVADFEARMAAAGAAATVAAHARAAEDTRQDTHGRGYNRGWDDRTRQGMRSPLETGYDVTGGAGVGGPRPGRPANREV